MNIINPRPIAFALLALCLGIWTVSPLIVPPSALAQIPRASLTDSLIAHSLDIFDLAPFQWTGAPEGLKARVGVYLNLLPADTVRRITGRADAPAGFRVWHVMPHWPADEAGMLIGDILLTMNGKPIGDSVYSGEEYVGVTARDMTPGDTAWFTIVRNGAIRDLPVKVTAGTRIPTPYTDPPRLGPLHQNSWLQSVIDKNDLGEWTTTIRKQMSTIADQDFCTVPFAGRPNPWRLNAVTYLHHHPTRVGAYSRMIVQDLWDGVAAGPGLSGAVTAAARHLDIALPQTPAPERPQNRNGLNAYLAQVQAMLDAAYAGLGRDLDTVTTQLTGLLSADQGWEDAIDTTADPVRKKSLRLQAESRLAAMFSKADKADLASLANAARMMAALADTAWLGRLAATFPVPAKPLHADGVEGAVVALWKTPMGTCVVGGPGPNRYTKDFCFILDLGGNDIYELPPARRGSVRFVADMGGNDIYRNAATGQGSGVGCVDVLADVAGDDIYQASHYAQGSGVLGVGILADFSGDDYYSAQWCSQGTGLLGIGILYDGGGADNYNAGIYSQAFGYTKGFGTILERGGNDSYRAGWKQLDGLARIAHRSYIAMSQGFGFGIRPWTTGVGTDGGIGVLSDVDGDDLYASDFFSQGGSYWYALGILHDERGSDRYTAGLYSQGSGIHLSFGALLDNAGDDTYDAYAGLEQGNAHDWSAGCLEDLEGNDTYRAAGSSQGSALNVSFAWLLDSHGDDQYYVRLSDTTLAQGGGNFNRIRRMGSMGMLVDLGRGDDQYVEQRLRPGTPLVKGNKGIIYDDGVPGK